MIEGGGVRERNERVRIQGWRLYIKTAENKSKACSIIIKSANLQSIGAVHCKLSFYCTLYQKSNKAFFIIDSYTDRSKKVAARGLNTSYFVD